MINYVCLIVTQLLWDPDSKNSDCNADQMEYRDLRDVSDSDEFVVALKRDVEWISD